MRVVKFNNVRNAFFRSRLYELLGLTFLLFSVSAFFSLLFHTATDPSWNLASEANVNNMLGAYGAIVSDLLLQLFGIASYIFVLFCLMIGVFILIKQKGLILLIRTVLFFIGFPLLLIGLAHWGQGGSLGYLTLKELQSLSLPLFAASLFGFIMSIPLLLLANGFKFTYLKLFLETFSKQSSEKERAEKPAKEIPKDKSVRIFDYINENKKEEKEEPEPKLKKTIQPKIKSTDGPLQLPPLELLYLPSDFSGQLDVDENVLHENAKVLESVLNDYGIRGEIVGIKPGPVVTLYELEPAPGIKSSRIIALADDIARSMSSISARVAVVPGKNVIGIELPNQIRETVHLRELLSHREYENSNAHLSLILGKDIGGSPIIADLARMPHLLVAGTTGSGKSVAVNAMILSLIYRLPPERCKFIMIDPKMLELSIYDGIPHLLAPVVTDPKKAVVALRWVVREMESRYQAMSKLSVRNIEGYNQRIMEAKSKGDVITRKVQTGFDPESGKPIFEEQPLTMEPLPFIVVVVDEMADLMLVAGKEIEAAVQRLAQMARAAGIHLIMATQRPSVDVITGTIKANFPTRISFQVSSKIDSRTILNEQGAEQLLGQGDMLYMAAGGRISRVHGPYVGDADVEKVVQFLKTQSPPSYIEDITVDPSSPDLDFGESNGGEEDALYQQALTLVRQEGKASTSFVQRHLKIGYNRAARLIDQMEDEGIISAANHVGRREVLSKG